MVDSSEDINMSATKLSETTTSLTMEPFSIKSPTVADLRNDTRLWYKLNVFIYDLRNFRDIPKSQERLDSIIDASYIGLPYFTTTEALTIKSAMIDTSPPVHPAMKKARSKTQPQSDLQPQSRTPEQSPHLKRLDKVIEETLNERLERRIKKREESGDFRVCAAHDLAPILEKALEIGVKDLQRDKEFLGLVERCGVDLQDGNVWMGLDVVGHRRIGGGGEKRRGKK